MLRYLLLCFLSLAMSGCTSNSCEHHIARPEPKVLVYGDTTALANIIWEFATELKYERRLHLEKSMVSVNEFQSTIHIDFSTMSILELCDARQLIVDIVDGYLQRIEESYASTQLRPSPLTADQFHITIDFQSFYGVYNDPFYIGWLVLENGMVYYYGFNVKDERFDHWSSLNEPFEQARVFAYAQRRAERKYEMTHPRKGRSALEGMRYRGPRVDRLRGTPSIEYPEGAKEAEFDRLHHIPYIEPMNRTSTSEYPAGARELDRQQHGVPFIEPQIDF